MLRKEPVLVLLAGLAGVVDLGLIAAVRLDWLTLDAGQIAAVVAFVTAACGLVAAVVRAAVTSPATAAGLERRLDAKVRQVARLEADAVVRPTGHLELDPTYTEADFDLTDHFDANGNLEGIPVPPETFLASDPTDDGAGGGA